MLFEDRIQKNPKLLRLKNQSTGEIIDWEIQELKDDEIEQKGTEVSAELLNGILNDIYLEEERKTNKVWIDGKTIYRKVINFGALPNATKKEVQHNISNISIFTKIEGIAIRNDETKFTQSLPLVYKNAEMFYNTALAVDNTIVEIQTASDRSMFNGYVTLEYTKTTEEEV